MSVVCHVAAVDGYALVVDLNVVFIAWARVHSWAVMLACGMVLTVSSAVGALVDHGAGSIQTGITEIAAAGILTVPCFDACGKHITTVHVGPLFAVVDGLAGAYVSCPTLCTLMAHPANTTVRAGIDT